MKLYLHPTRHEALTSSTTAITRWSLATNPATILAQLSDVPESLYSPGYDPVGRLHIGGITSSPDGRLFAHEFLNPAAELGQGPCVLEWRTWDDLSQVRTIAVPGTRVQMTSLASSPDGRWLLLSSGSREQLFLLDWQTGEVLSQQYTFGSLISGLTFDPSSTIVAGLTCHENRGRCVLWRLAPTERFVSQPGETRRPPPEPVMQEVASGGMALRVVHEALDRTGIAWPQRDLAETLCQTVFSPDSKLVFFNPMHLEYSGCGLELVAYEVNSGKRLWSICHERANTGSFILTPDGSFLLVPMEDNNLFVYRVADGMLEQRLPTGLNESIQALVYDHDGTTLWLATEEQLVRYQPRS